MVLIELLINYLRWHYTLAVRNIFLIWSDFVWFLWNYFSIRQLTRTFFVPWRRLGETAVDIFDFFNYFSSIVITFLMRIVGMIVRTLVIITGLISIFLSAIVGLGFLLVWILMPLLLVIIFVVGIKMVIKRF